MSEFENAFDFSEQEDDELDIAAIFGDPVPAVAAPPPAAGAVDRPESTKDSAHAAEQAAQKKPRLKASTYTNYETLQKV